MTGPGDPTPPRGPEPGAQASRQFRARLNELFEHHRQANGRKLRNVEVARWLTSHGYEASESHIGNLRNYDGLLPSLRLVEGLAAFFEVPLSSMLSEQETETALRQLMADAGVVSFALRAQGLSADSLVAISKVLDGLRAVENLPPVDAPSADGED